MLIPKELILEAKEKLGEKAAEIIQEELDIQNWDSKNLKGSCPLGHSDSTPSFVFNPKIYSFHCFSCGRNFSIIDLYMHRGMTFLGAVEKLFNEVGIEYKFSERGIKTKRNYKYPIVQCSEDRSIVDDYFKGRKISKETLDYCNIGQDIYDNVVWRFYDENDNLITVKLRHSHKPTEKEDKEWYLPNYDYTPILFNMNRVDPSNGPLVITEGQCFPPETEILTEDGWVRFDNYKNQKVMMVNDDLTGEFITPMAKIIKKYDGLLYKVKRKNNSFEMTPDHNIVILENNKIIKRKLEDMPNTVRGEVPVAIAHDGIGIPLSNDQLALFIAISADGTLDERKDGIPYVRFQVKKQRKAERFEKLLIANNIKHIKSVYKNGFVFFGFRAPEWVRSKMFDQNWISLSSIEQKRFIIDEMVHWDGNHVHNRNQFEYNSNVYENATFIQTIAHLCGYMATICPKHKGKYKPVFAVHILFDKDSVCWQDIKKHIATRKYEGIVYCVSVPSGMILTRYEDHIMVCGNCDTLAVIESGYYNVVSVPGGSQNNKWIEECFDWLEEFKQIVIFSDGDEAGIKMRKEVVARLGQWRCKFVEIPEEYLKVNKELKDANAILYKYGKQAVLDLINNAQEIPIIGVTNLASVDDFEIDKAEGFITNIPSLDEMLYKIVFGNVMVITGRRGEGKSSFINQLLCEALDQGYDSFIFSGELSAPVLKSWLNVTMAGYEKVTMKNKFVHQINPDAKKNMEQWYNERLWFYDDQTSNGTDDILNKAIAVTRKYGAKLWILDNLLVMDINSKSTDVYEKQKDFMTKLIGLANLYNVLIVLAIHPRKGQNGVEIAADDVGGSGALTNLPQYVLATKKFSEKEKQGTKDGRGNYKKGLEPIDEDVSISVLKNRFIGRTGEVRLYFDYKSRRFFCNTTHLNRRYKWNNDNSPLCKYNPLDEKVPDGMHP